MIIVSKYSNNLKPPPMPPAPPTPKKNTLVSGNAGDKIIFTRANAIIFLINSTGFCK